MAEERFLLENATIYDGSGKPPQRGDVLIEGGFITGCGDIPRWLAPDGTSLIDLSGLAVSPGFINLHSHSDVQVLTYPEAKTLVMQGITTEVVGNCGGSAVDTSRWAEDEWRRVLSRSGLPHRWNGVREYLEAVAEVGPAVNVAALFGHGDIRRAIVGDHGRPMTEAEKTRAAEMAGAYMAEGAFGVSSGLEYVPGRFADVSELAAVSRPVAERGGFHASHMRNEGPGLLDSIAECIQVTRLSGVRFEVSHIKACGPDNWGKVREALAMLDAESGLEMTADFYPYLASSTELAIVLPDWILQEGKERALELLRGEEVRRNAQAESDARTQAQGGWGRIVITSVKEARNKWMEGLDLSMIAGRLGKREPEVVIDILIDEKMQVRIARFAMSEQDLVEALRHPKTCVVTDGNNAVPEEGKPHPRSVGTYPRVLGRYARDKGVISMEEAVKKMTSLPARRLGIRDRGLIAPGYRADLVAFDPEKIIDRATYDDPWQYPEGIFAVFVNGLPVVWEGEMTGKRPGMPLRHEATQRKSIL